MIEEAEERDHLEMRQRLEIWDVYEGDKTYAVRIAHSQTTATRPGGEVDRQSRAYEKKHAENLRLVSEQLLTQQMPGIKTLQEEQIKPGMLLDNNGLSGWAYR
jgi:RNA-binding protein 25